MKRFVFKLDPLLRQRERTEKDRQRALAEIEAERRELEGTLRRHQSTLAEGKQGLRDGLVGSLDVRALRQHATTAIQLERHARQLVVQLAGVHARLDEARGALVEATRQRRAVEVLRERRYAEWRADLDREETNDIDELATNAAARSAEGATP
jgi:flagellar FliJ protein